MIQTQIRECDLQLISQLNRQDVVIKNVESIVTINLLENRLSMVSTLEVRGFGSTFRVPILMEGWPAAEPSLINALTIIRNELATSIDEFSVALRKLCESERNAKIRQIRPTQF